MIWALVIIVGGWGGYGTPRVAVTVVDNFNTRTACLTAATTVKSLADSDINVRVACVPKSDLK